MSAARGRGRGGGGEAAESEERWLLTYADMITLLMALFIVLWAISSVNVSKFAQLKASLHSAFSAKVVPAGTSILSGSTSPFEQPGSPIQPIQQSGPGQGIVTVQSVQQQISARISQSIAAKATQQDLSNLRHIQQLVRQYAAQHGLSSVVKTSIDQRGLVLRLLTDKVLFASGQAAIQPAGIPLLSEIANLLAGPDIVNPVRVEGNTDNRPIHSARYPSNWELSSARADAVLEFLLGNRVSADRLSATGFGDVNPIASNSTAAGEATNRRVDIIILRRSFG
jgi:chemotaxis protein MotB